MILDNSVIQFQLEELWRNFEGQPSLDWYEEYLRVAATVDEWKFSSGDYFSPAPYEAERGGFPSPRLIKKPYRDVDEARWLGKYCSGFVAGNHTVTVMPSEPNIQALDADFYSAGKDGEITIQSISCKSMSRPGRRNSRIIGMRRFFELGSDSKLYMGVGEGGSWFVFVYKYFSGRPVSARGYSDGGASESGWEFHYDDAGGLIKITTGSSVMWARKQ
ncbi:hypothetical protein [Serratia ureilytica]|uniref:hypothetical protein n=1 Tax=Serratia ureilytica TaxID=300181 RepID=UPI001D188435|nr:hypothetical protein [Serratia ureilytica]MCC4104756.1 hypothetical protein [Serratia ureilytica]